jgi:hypothetical protein
LAGIPDEKEHRMSKKSGPPPNSAPGTLHHSRRVGALMGQAIAELVQRSYQHDLSKLSEEEKPYFDRATEELAGLTYGTPEYFASLARIRPALEHHFAHNRHHPEHHARGVDDMTLMDLVELIADWQDSTTRVTDGDLVRSVNLNMARFGIDAQLARVLLNTAVALGWIPQVDEERMPQSVGDHGFYRDDVRKMLVGAVERRAEPASPDTREELQAQVDAARAEAGQD